MEAPVFHTRLQFPLRPACTSIGKTKELNVSAQKKLEDGYPSLAMDKVPRRAILGLVGGNVILGNVCTVLAAPMQDMKEPNVLSTVDQFSGESSPVIIRLDDEQIIKGLKEVLTGMKVGGKRRALIPPSVGYISDTMQPFPKEFGPRRSLLSHANEPLVFEVQLLKVL